MSAGLRLTTVVRTSLGITGQRTCGYSEAAGILDSSTDQHQQQCNRPPNPTQDKCLDDLGSAHLPIFGYYCQRTKRRGRITKDGGDRPG
jgi:hypothetical protein